MNKTKLICVQCEETLAVLCFFLKILCLETITCMLLFLSPFVTTYPVDLEKGRRRVVHVMGKNFFCATLYQVSQITM